MEEWNIVKKLVVAVLYPRDSMWKLWDLIDKYHSTEFPNILTLAQLALTSAVHTAGCRRDISEQNNILTSL